MRLWLLSQTANDDYDTFDALVVAAETEDEARMITPGGKPFDLENRYSDWCSSPDKVTVELLGVAIHGMPAGIILGSFNAG